jgi:hypothetical protein
MTSCAHLTRSGTWIQGTFTVPMMCSWYSQSRWRSQPSGIITPIALIHIVGKLISKVLANRLAPWLENLVHVSQSAFIKGHFIPDNFKLVQTSTKMLHARRVACILLKVDIACVFDSVSWSFLLQVMQFVGFSRLWCDWVAVILSSTSTKVLLNGIPSDRICHAQGLRQGDSLSPMLFLLVMEVLSALIKKAESWSLLHPLGACPISHRASLYVDDLVLFVAPYQQDLQIIRTILLLFESVSK